ncbi:MAG TPA: TonB-dependent receptor [Sphingopyxis sp.]|nr:TonB-dependent receptor [Sphingopyxis sp.]HMP44723.1 TonB-dependent receptor [Sphingopyxis sp.]HMQ17718.1 TonB-dependent receptor [Sphingopyxis sp.]
MNRLKFSLLAGTALLAGAATVPAHAQQAADAAEEQASGGVQDIIVTATRRAERLQDVPIAVTALSGESLSAQGIDSVQDVQRATPSLNIAPFPGDPGTASVSLRGLVATEALPTVDPAVGLYLDGVYIARATGANLNLIDVERVEVLRGPQGTLFGRNTIGGAINIVTKRPTNEFEGEVSAGYGNHDAWNLSGVVNIPAGDRLALRFAASHSQRDGFAKSALTGLPLAVDNTEYLRGQIAYQLTDNWDILLSADYSDTRFRGGQWVTPVAQTGTAALIVNTQPPAGDSPADYNQPFTNRPPSQVTGLYRNTVWGVGGTITGEMDAITFKAIIGYRNLDKHLTGNDLDGTPYTLLQQIYGDDRQNQVSTEFQLFGRAFDDRLDWIVGAYYFSEDGVNDSRAHFLAPFVVTQGRTYGESNNTSLSFFGQFTFRLTEELRLTAGARYVHDTRQLTSRNLNYAGADTDVVASCGSALATAPVCEINLKPAKFNYVPFTVGLDYKPVPDVMLFAKYTQGYRAGGFNLRGNDLLGLAPFGPEKVRSIEGGVKADLFDRMLRLNLTAYNSKYTAIQLSGNIPNFDLNGDFIGNSAVIQNAGSARINGVEAEATLVLGGLTLGQTIGHTDHKYTSIAPTAVGVTLASPPLLSPAWTASTTVDYKLPTSFGSVSLHGDYSYRSRVFFASQPRTNPALPELSQAGYGLFGAVLTVHLDNPDLDISAWVRNIGNKKYNQRSVDFTALGFMSYFPGDPRTYGVRATYRF